VRSVERFEEEIVRRLCHAELNVHERATALRILIELRHCTAREASTFFQVPAEITVRALVLLAPPLDFAALVADSARALRSAKRRTKAA
jgi:hypothetical protein